MSARQVLQARPESGPSLPWPPADPGAATMQLVGVRELPSALVREANAIDGYYDALERQTPVLDALVAQVTAFRDFVCSEENVARQADGVLTAVGSLDRVADVGRRALEDTRRARDAVQRATS
jgi:hypothetical protein